jgi:heme/copper-type cytochrome/quinol oxidase subunit 3
MVNALASIQRGETRKMRTSLIATMGLGLVFFSGQAIEFTLLNQHGLSLSSNLFGASFFTLTGFHGAHVLAGVIWISFIVVNQPGLRNFPIGYLRFLCRHSPAYI